MNQLRSNIDSLRKNLVVLGVIYAKNIFAYVSLHTSFVKSQCV
jgi:hypothetical protein